MANAFTISRSFPYGNTHGKELVRVYGILVVDTTASGGATKGDLPASLFGLQAIEASGSIVNDDETKIFVGSPCYDKTSLMVGIGTDQAVMDLPNDTYRLWVEGTK